ncbi:MAG: hypothetical protein ABIH72_00145 [archaeon]
MVTKEEVEAKLNTMSDFLKMEYLEYCLKDSDFSVKRFCHQKLAELYEDRKMFSEAAKNMSSVAEVSLSFKDKREAYMKEVELWLKAGHFDMFDNALTRGLSIGNVSEKEEMKRAIKDLLKRQGQSYEKSMKRGAAVKVYEKLFQMSDTSEKEGVKLKLMELYDKLGKIREYMALKK